MGKLVRLESSKKTSKPTNNNNKQQNNSNKGVHKNSGKRRVTNINSILRKKRGELQRHFKFFDENLANKRVTYYFNSKGIPKRRTIYFYKRNFMHLCGVTKYVSGATGFYKDCAEGTLKTSRSWSYNPKLVPTKIEALGNLPKLLEQKFVGFSDDTVVHKKVNYGEMVRTKEDLIALGTVEDRATKNQVPISLINLEVSDSGMKKATSNWCKVHSITVKDIEENDTHAYKEDHDLDIIMEMKSERSVKKNRKKQLAENKKKSKGNTKKKH